MKRTSSWKTILNTQKRSPQLPPIEKRPEKTNLALLNLSSLYDESHAIRWSEKTVIGKVYHDVKDRFRSAVMPQNLEINSFLQQRDVAWINAAVGNRKSNVTTGQLMLLAIIHPSICGIPQRFVNYVKSQSYRSKEGIHNPKLKI